MENNPNLESNNQKKFKLDFKESKYATGRRKKSIARIWIKKGTGKSYVNGKSIVIDEAYSTLNIVNDYLLKCKSYIFLKNDLKKIDRFKKLYFINYRKYYKIDKVLKKC